MYLPCPRVPQSSIPTGTTETSGFKHTNSHDMIFYFSKAFINSFLNQGFLVTLRYLHRGLGAKSTTDMDIHRDVGAESTDMDIHRDVGTESTDMDIHRGEGT